jgi:acetolactate synthase-1/2/3 large subunit
VYQSADLILSLGSRNEEFQTASWSYFPDGASLIQVDIDPTEIGRNLIPTVPVVSDVKLFLSDLLEVIKRRAQKVQTAQKSRIHFKIGNKAVFIAEVDKECQDRSQPIKSKRVIYEACRLFGSKTILVNENGSQDLWSYYWPYWAVGALDGCIAPAEQTCMGFGVAGCIGAKLASPDRPVVCTTGDGAFQMFMKELPTAVQYKAPVTWIVLNNFSLGWIKLHEKVKRRRFLAVDFDPQPDFAKVAEASGCYGERVIKPDDVTTALLRAVKENKRGVPAVLDFIIDPWDFPEGFKEMQPQLFT